jgi:sigma-54 specific flagellar transcriptional regulator A
MLRESKILLIEDDAERRHDLTVILSFLGEEHISTTSAEWRSAVAGLAASSEVLGVLLGACDCKHGPIEVLRQLAAWDEFLPVIQLGEVVPADCPEELRSHLLATLDVPPSYSRLVDSMHRAQVYREMHDEARERGWHRELNLFRSLIGTSRVIQDVRQMMQQVADTDATVLVLGETGTDKEVVARNLHYNSKRRDAPFVPVNCGAIAAELLESELFGHEKGAFSGAFSSRAGRFELAQGGTVFLDEVDAMPLTMQVKLLRVLQEQVFERVGSNKTQSVDVRIIAATHKDLEKLIEEERFREDLFYRLNVFPIEMAPLRERTEDIPLLINELISRMEHEKRGSIRFNSAAIMSLCQHDWPGNVRELANLVERMAIMHPYGVIGVAELPKKFRHVDDESVMTGAEANQGQEERESFNFNQIPATTLTQLPTEGLDLKDYLSNLEQSLIQQALDEANGVVARAAERLRIRRTTLVEKMRKYGMSRRYEDGDEDE